MANYNPLPAPGDIVWCNYPESEDLGNPGPKPRPGLILNVFTDIHAVLITYGTSQKTDKEKVYPGEFVIDDQLDTAGLAKPTKFDLNRLQKLPFNEQWFGVAPGVEKNTPLPKLGVLPPSFMPLMRAAWKDRKQ
ncbi:type II toxin-antitoxin system PemK/MazF family toxin [Enterobacter ludwigii]